MRIAHLDHGVEDLVPGVRCFEDGVREHTSIPANVLDATGGGVFEPVPGCFGDVEFAIWIISAAMFAGFVMAASAVDGAVILRDVEVDGPWTEGIGHLFVSGPEFGIGIAFFQESVLRSIVAEGVKIGVGEVSLETKRLGHADAFEDVEHVFPGMHASPADFAFGGKAFTAVFGDGGSLLEGIDDAGGVGRWVFTPFGKTEFSGVDADDAIFPNSMFVENLGNAAGHFHGAEEFFLLGVVTHRRIANGAGPDWGDEGTDGEALACDQISDALDFVVTRIWIGVREEEEVVDALKFLAVDVCSGREVEHAFQADGRFLTFAVAFADESWPHGVMEFRKRHDDVVFLVGGEKIADAGALISEFGGKCTQKIDKLF